MDRLNPGDPSTRRWADRWRAQGSWWLRELGRIARYTAHELRVIGAHVAERPLRRASWGVLLNLPRFRELVPGRIYRSGDPRLRVHDAHLLTLGVHTLVCVRTGGPSDRTRALAARYRLRIVEHHFGARPYHDQAVREALRDALAPENHPVLVHCDGGRHRSGVVGALVRVHIGWSLEAAITEYFELAQPSPSPDDVLVITRVAGQVARRT